MKTNQTLYAVCKRNEGYPASPELGRAYQVLLDPEAAEHSLLRIVDESGEDYLYPREYFAEPYAKPRREIPWRWVGRSIGLIALLRHARGRAKR